MNDATSNLPQPPFRLKALLFTLRVPSSSSIWHHQWHAYINRLACKSLLSARSFTFWDGAASLASYVFLFYIFFCFPSALLFVCCLKLNGKKFSSQRDSFFFYFAEREKRKLLQKIFYYTKKSNIFPTTTMMLRIHIWVNNLAFVSRSVMRRDLGVLLFAVWKNSRFRQQQQFAAMHCCCRL